MRSIDGLQITIEEELRALRTLSVTNLVKVISILQMNQNRGEGQQMQAWIPFRESVLTQYMQHPYLDGNAKLCFVCGMENQLLKDTHENPETDRASIQGILQFAITASKLKSCVRKTIIPANSGGSLIESLQN